MNEEKNKNKEDQSTHKIPAENTEERERLEEKIDEELIESFPASDPPSYSQPGNDDIKENC